MRSPEARKAAEALAPLQLGMAKRGAEAYVHSEGAVGERIRDFEDRLPQRLERDLETSDP